VFDMLAELSRGQPCDMTGVGGHAGLDGRFAGGVQWPVPEGESDVAPERRLFENGRFFTPDGRARFVFGDPAPPPEVPSDRYPLVLLTGRGSTAQWHTLTRSSRSPVLAKLSPEKLHVDVSPTDARARGLRSGDVVWVSSRRGRIEATVFVSPVVKPGQVFLSMHDPAVNVLTAEGFDPHSRQPAYKYSAVELIPEAEIS